MDKNGDKDGDQKVTKSGGELDATSISEGQPGTSGETQSQYQASPPCNYSPLHMNQQFPPWSLPLNFYQSHLPNMNTTSPVSQHCPVPTTPTTPMNHTQVDPLTVILQRLDAMDKRLSTIETLQNSMKAIQSTLSGVSQKVDEMEKRLNDLEKEIKEEKTYRELHSATIEIIDQKQKENENAINNVSKVSKRESSSLSDSSELKAEIVELKCRSMRDNLMFYKIPEEQNENCEEKVLHFIQEKMGIENAQSNIKLHRAHRIGRYDRQKIRPIVAKFVFYPDRERVRKSGKALKGTVFGVSEKFPREIIARRQTLIPIMKKARQEGKEAFLNVDKLYINNELYTEQK